MLSFSHALNSNKASNAGIYKKILSFEIGQQMYNAQSGMLPDKSYIDRPITAYLYASAAFDFHYRSETSLKLGAKVGTIGPSALGRQAQNFIHNTFGFYEPNTWDYQLKKEFNLNIFANYTRLLFRSRGFDLSTDNYASLGNALTGAGAGILLRAGSFNQLFQTASTHSLISNGATDVAPLNSKEFFVYTRPMINLVVYDATIQGGLFNGEKDHYAFDQKKLVYSQQVGITYSKRRFTIDASALFKTREIKSPARAHQWGSVSATYQFN
jgi:lipid A 3-O-deacylase